MNSIQRISTLQSLRFVFITLIFMSHIGIGSHHFDFGGDCGVAFFFILSGFVLSLRYSKELSSACFSPREFITKRLRNYYLLHLLTLVGALVIYGLGKRAFCKIICNLLLLQSWIPIPDFFFYGNSVAWFLSTITFLYIIFAFMFKFISVAKPIWLLLILAVYLFVAFLIPKTYAIGLIYIHPISRAFDFGLGIIIWRIYSIYSAFSLRAWQGTMVEFALITLYVLLYLVYPYCPLTYKLSSVFWVPHILLILYFSSQQHFDTPLGKLLRTPFLQYMGNHTLEIFLTHQLCIYVVTRGLVHIGYDDYYVLKLCLSVILTTLAVAVYDKASCQLVRLIKKYCCPVKKLNFSTPKCEFFKYVL
ncbi:acyltransferase [Prevotella sp. S7 MS 2]|uniref:acyltransferase family protein n=1 Tax=Prevotella sp. S7 MS 2 TaxID=1287488 RepID=UPI000513E474|nr:acyltransferase [Prevotella sp. S7 MS 2]KGI61270.1 hypothetical protein HMPREF0671_01455 [Prevotella sp. S7 MS 2]